VAPGRQGSSSSPTNPTYCRFVRHTLQVLQRIRLSGDPYEQGFLTSDLESQIEPGFIDGQSRGTAYLEVGYHHCPHLVAAHPPDRDISFAISAEKAQQDRSTAQ
jgi:hypothetical protein